MTAQNTHRSYLGIAKETTKGTPVAPTSFIAVSSGKIKPVDVIDPLYDDGLRGSLVKNYNYIPGRTRSTFDFGGAVFADGIGWGLAGLLGSVATTGASAPYTHTISLKNSSTAAADAQPISYTITDFYSAAVRAYPGCQINEVDISFSADGMMEYDVKTTGWISATASTPSPSFTTVLPTPSWQATVTIGGSAVSNAVEGSINMSRSATPIYGLSNTQNPFSVFLGALEVKGKFKFVMENDTELLRFLNNTQPAIVLDWSQGSGSTATQIQATITKGAYVVADIDRGKDFVEVAVDIVGLGNTTDAGSTGGYAPIKWVVKNAVASGTYA